MHSSVFSSNLSDLCTPRKTMTDVINVSLFVNLIRIKMMMANYSIFVYKIPSPNVFDIYLLSYKDNIDIMCFAHVHRGKETNCSVLLSTYIWERIRRQELT